MSKTGSNEMTEGESSFAIRSRRESFNKAIANHDAKSIGAFLAPAYHIVTGRSDQFHGAEEEPRRWAEVFENDASVVYLRKPREIRVNESWGLAEELGDWTGRYSAENGMVNAAGVYSAKWQRAQNGDWLIQAEVFTTLHCDGPAGGCVEPDPIVR
ncbi:MAG: nuclear transport factor 2 family protein [Anaerolineales bacterium]|uniref:YybH family protein n=1 Tax=Candidatus Villigracilis proximus TaxID=3140683 RepID=UPI003136F591|nr:nuclear transport factor 2 family protein [Anaerolineales bacterium]